MSPRDRPPPCKWAARAQSHARTPPAAAAAAALVGCRRRPRCLCVAVLAVRWSRLRSGGGEYVGDVGRTVEQRLVEEVHGELLVEVGARVLVGDERKDET